MIIYLLTTYCFINIFLIFLLMHIARRSPIWVMWVGADILLEKRLLTLFLDTSESRKFITVVKDEATVDAFKDMYITH